MSTHADTATRLARVAPQIRPAGVAGDTTNPTVRDLTSSYNPDGCVTPDGIRKFRHRGADVGVSRRHWGLAADPPADGNARYGVTAPSQGGVDVCLRPGVHADKMSTLVGEQREKNYASERRRPLGRSPQPADPVPVPLSGFGRRNERGESTASTMAAMRDVEMLYPVGAQKDHRYDWQATGIDPTGHRFGVPSDRSETAGSLFRGGRETVLVSKVAKDYQSTVAHEVGKPRRYGFDDPSEWGEDKRRAASNRPNAANGFQSEQPTVKELLSTWSEEGEEDALTGEGSRSRSRRAMLESRTSAPTKGTADAGPRATIDTMRRNGDTVAALAAMEDEASVPQLVNPCHYVSLGVQSRYFAGGRDLEDVRALAAKCGFGLTDAQVNEVFASIAVDGKCGIEQFKNAASAKRCL